MHRYLRRKGALISYCTILYFTIALYFKGQENNWESGGISLGFSGNSSKGLQETDALAEKSRDWIPHLCPGFKKTYQKNYLQEALSEVVWERPSSDAIFFVQTSCRMVLLGREACAVESASSHHPHRPILVFVTSPFINERHPIMKTLLSLPGVKFVWLDLDEVFRNEPLLDWHKQRMWMYNPEISSALISDAVRTELLRSYGGTYIDLDAITLRPLPNGTNWLARVDQNHVTLAVSSFSPGHPLLKRAAESLPKSFNPLESDSIGPSLVTAILHSMCPENITIPDTSDRDTSELCGDIKVFPANSFYPVSYLHLKDIFEGQRLGHQFLLKHGDAYSFHIFTSLTYDVRVTLGKDTILEEIAKRNCPKIYDVVFRNEHLL